VPGTLAQGIDNRERTQQLEEHRVVPGDDRGGLDQLAQRGPVQLSDQ
jgi:hypothetical protein